MLAPACCLLPVSLTSSGCNSGKQLQRDLVQRELRLQEDEIYRLEDCLEQYQAKVRNLRRQNAELQDQIGYVSDGPTAAGGDGSSRRSDPERAESDGLLDGSNSRQTPDAGEPGVPEIDLGDPIEMPTADPPRASGPPPIDVPPIDVPVDPTGEAPPFDPSATPEPPSPIRPTPGTPTPIVPEEITPPTAADGPASEAPAFEPLGFLPEPGDASPIAQAASLPAAPLPAVSNPSEPNLLEVLDGLATLVEPVEPVAAFAESAPPKAPELVQSLVLRVTPGPDEPTGESTLVVVVAPQTFDGAAAPFSGEASVMLRDPTAPIGGERIARWDYTPAEVYEAWGDLSQSVELNFLVALPDNVPTDRPLEVWVRVVDDEGRKTLAKTGVHLGGQTVALAPPPAIDPPPAMPRTLFSSGKSGSATSEPQKPDSWRPAPPAPGQSELRLATHEEPSGDR